MCGKRLAFRRLLHLSKGLCLLRRGPASPRGSKESRAQQPLDGRDRIFHDELLDNLAGDWKITRKFKTRTVENTAKAEWVLNHQFPLIKMKDTLVRK